MNSESREWQRPNYTNVPMKCCTLTRNYRANGDEKTADCASGAIFHSLYNEVRLRRALAYNVYVCDVAGLGGQMNDDRNDLPDLPLNCPTIQNVV